MEKVQANICCHHHLKNGTCTSLLIAHMLEVGTLTLKAHLNALQEAVAHPLRGACWQFTHVCTA